MQVDNGVTVSRLLTHLTHLHVSANVCSLFMAKLHHGSPLDGLENGRKAVAGACRLSPQANPTMSRQATASSKAYIKGGRARGAIIITGGHVYAKPYNVVCSLWV